MLRLPLLATALVLLVAPPLAAAQDWVEGARLSTTAQHDAELATGPDGDVVAVWQEPGRIRGAELSTRSAGFGAPFTIATTSRDTELRAALGPDGRLTVAWIEGEQLGSNPSHDGVVRAVSGRPGAAFPDPQTVDTPERHRGLGLAIGPDGIAYVAYARRATDANRLDLFVARRAADAAAFAPETELLHQVTSSLSRGRIAIVAARGGATVLHHQDPLVQAVEVSAPGVATAVGPMLIPEPQAALLADGTLVAAHGVLGATASGPSLSRETAVRARPRGGAFGPSEPLPTLTALALTGAGSRLAAIGGSAGDGRLAVVGTTAELATRRLPAGTSVALAGAPDGRALAATAGGGGVHATLALAGAGFGSVDRVLPDLSGEFVTVAAGLGRGAAVLAVRSGGDLRTVLRGERIATTPPDASGPSGAGPKRKPRGCRPVGRRTRTLRRGGVTVRFRDLGRVVSRGERPTLRLAVRRGRAKLRRVELVHGRHRVRDARAPYRLRLPRATSARTGTKRITVRIVLRSGRTARTTLKVAVAPCAA